MACIDRNRSAEVDLDIVAGTGAAVGLLGDEGSRSAGAALVDRHGARVSLIVIHLGLRHREAIVLGHGSSREADSPVEGTTCADGGSVGAVIITDPASLCRSSVMDEADVVNIPAVIVAAHAAVLGISPLEGVGASGDGIFFHLPVAIAGDIHLLRAVDVEVTFIVVGFAGDLVIEAHQAVTADFHGDFDGRSGGVIAGVAALHAVAVVHSTGDNAPRISCIVDPVE